MPTVANRVGGRSRLVLPALLVLLLSSGCSPVQTPSVTQDTTGAFVGSSTCRDCHLDIYTRWQDTLMANVLQDPRERPSAILADFDTDNPLVTFEPDDVAFTYGSKWKQRYFTQIGG